LVACAASSLVLTSSTREGVGAARSRNFDVGTLNCNTQPKEQKKKKKKREKVCVEMAGHKNFRIRTDF
jgi:hypothetical protein